ncbi:MAG: conserved phage C-terminal domain-containing protein [Olsenella uli]|uniref:conserved phage C-terminal domain-containing protein n=1 Tax=Olsenella uli TaxID=133926 RepID=UPI001E0C1C8B|nr:conserved phage C-terminal domain-containing protein [Olsenella uli]MBS6418855.1 conserved phage C-terminal domain-containing protein [Olsenella uli]
MKVGIQEDMYEVVSSLPGDQGDRLSRALLDFGFAGVDPEPCQDAWYFAFLAFRGRIELSAARTRNAEAAAAVRWGRRDADADAAPAPHAEDTQAQGSHDAEAMRMHDAENENESEKEDEKDTLCGSVGGQAPSGRDDAVRDASSRFVSRLNELNGTSFSPDSASTLRLVSGRMRDGATANDLCAVAEVKSAQWRGRADMRSYLRPQTLLRATNFEGYLQEARASPGLASSFAAYDVAPDLVIGGEA